VNAALLIARLLLSSVFIVAGVAKLVDRAGSARAMAAFGVPAAVASPLGVVLPLAELIIGAALIPTSTAWWGALGALTLLLLFVAGIGLSLARGQRPDCRCFGQLHSAPAGWKTLARNGVLAVVAGLVVLGGYDRAGPSVLSPLGGLSAFQLLSLIGALVMLGLLGGQWWFSVRLLRQNGRLLMRMEALEARLAPGDGAVTPRNGTRPAPGLPVGSPAPGFNLSGLYGEALTLEALRAPGKPIMLLFTDPKCGPCTALLPDIGRWQREYAEKLTVSLISRGDPEENRTKSSEHGLTGVLLQKDWEISEAYRAKGTPSAVIVRPDGTIGSSVVAGSEAIKDLVARALRTPAQLLRGPAPRGGPCPKCGKAHPNGDDGAKRAMLAAPKIGEPVPEIKLEDITGKEINFKEAFEAEETLVLFWHPGCGFCRGMLPELKEWEENPPKGAPKLLVVSAGDKKTSEAMGLNSPVVLDQQFAAGRAFGASGTPAGVLLDPEGKVASEVAVGAPAVLGLARAGSKRAS
jgi:thiol-disulfide isomerase/thioredoxin/uncharacterized membrane protein YphA (DoxX/SURF4 family)